VGNQIRWIALVFLYATALIAGCGKTNDQKPVYPVNGKVTFKGEPTDGAMITFHPLNDPNPRALRSHATVDKNGQYKLTTYLTGDGAPAGEYTVTIYWPAQRTKGKSDDPTAEEEDLPPDRLNRVYTVPATTKLRATVQEQPNTIDFKLP